MIGDLTTEQALHKAIAYGRATVLPAARPSAAPEPLGLQVARIVDREWPAGEWSEECRLNIHRVMCSAILYLGPLDTARSAERAEGEGKQ